MLKDQYIQYHFAGKISIHPPRSGICAPKKALIRHRDIHSQRSSTVPSSILLKKKNNPIYKVIISWLLRFQITSPCHGTAGGLRHLPLRPAVLVSVLPRRLVRWVWWRVQHPAAHPGDRGATLHSALGMRSCSKCCHEMIECGKSSWKN